MAQVSVKNLLTGAQTIAQSYFDATYGANGVKVFRRKPSDRTYARFKELFTTNNSQQTLVFFWPTPAQNDDAWVTTPGASLKEDWIISAEIYRQVVDSDTAWDAWLDFIEGFRAELARESNIRLGQVPGIRAGPWQIGELGVGNAAGFHWRVVLTAYVHNQPRNTAI